MLVLKNTETHGDWEVLVPAFQDTSIYIYIYILCIKVVA